MADSEGKEKGSEEPEPPPPSEATATKSDTTFGKTNEEFGGESLILEEGGEAAEDELEVVEEEEEVIYNSEDFISQPYLSEYCSLPENVLEFDYSYGYDCKRYFNLCVMDRHILIFASGNLIHFLNADTGLKWYRRCHSGLGIGHIAVSSLFHWFEL